MRFFNHIKRKMPSLSTKERKTKLRVPIKEFNDEIKVNRGLQAELECK